MKIIRKDPMKRTLATRLVLVATTACTAQATDIQPTDAVPVAPTADTRMVPAPVHELKNYNPSQSLAPLALIELEQLKGTL
jgi:hypothetical protein